MSSNAPHHVFSVPFTKFKITSDFFILEKQIVKVVDYPFTVLHCIKAILELVDRQEGKGNLIQTMININLTWAAVKVKVYRLNLNTTQQQKPGSRQVIHQVSLSVVINY